MELGDPCLRLHEAFREFRVGCIVGRFYLLIADPEVPDIDAVELLRILPEGCVPVGTDIFYDFANRPFDLFKVAPPACHPGLHVQRFPHMEKRVLSASMMVSSGRDLIWRPRWPVQ